MQIAPCHIHAILFHWSTLILLLPKDSRGASPCYPAQTFIPPFLQDVLWVYWPSSCFLDKIISTPPSGSVVKNPAAVQLRWRIRYLNREGPLEGVMATHSSSLAWRIPWTEVPEGLQSMGLQSQTWLKQLSVQPYFSALLFMFILLRILFSSLSVNLNVTWTF